MKSSMDIFFYKDELQEGLKSAECEGTDNKISSRISGNRRGFRRLLRTKRCSTLCCAGPFKLDYQDEGFITHTASTRPYYM